jgi:hypothetical protein
MPILLQRRLAGRNELVDVPEEVQNAPGVKRFHEFLGEIGMESRDDLRELAQVLKVPLEQMIKTTAQDLIEGPAQENISRYVRECRVNGASLQFLQSQSGDAGEKNAKVADPDDFDFKDRCG